LFHLNDGRQFSIPNKMDTPHFSHPKHKLLLFSDVLFQGEQVLTHLFLADPQRGELQDLSGELSVVEDRVPAWSSDGEWIAFTRKMSGMRMGRQLGIMQADGAAPFPLTDDAAYTHTFPAWSPDDRCLTFQRSSLEDPASPPEIWVLDVSSGQRRKVAAPGMQPAWLP
jgi:Tol biopolymer transport system component